MVVRRLLAAGLIALAAAQAIVVLFVHPPQEPLPRRADAVVVLSGDHGDRLDLGLELARRGVASTLVILRPSDGPAARALPLCGSTVGHVEVMCADPPIVSTRGDGRYLRTLARTRRWDEVVVVTSRFHGRRSGLLIGRCVEARVTIAISRPSLGWHVWMHAIAHELGGLGEAVVLRRGC